MRNSHVEEDVTFFILAAFLRTQAKGLQDDTDEEVNSIGSCGQVEG